MALTEQERLHLENALEQVALAETAAQALRYSYQRRPEIRDALDYDDAEWERWDALTVRFARLSDILTQRVFRAIDRVEFLPAGATFIDRINRAEKRGNIRSVYEWKEIREIRNQIVHDYATAYLLPLLRDVVQYIPELLECVGRLGEYKRIIKQRLEDSITQG
ncbi:MAG: hypothetical protein L6435_04220 [Anaerolineae bacterium]|nr:hypothetical protein [Anaerolineae bacterium]